MLVDATWEGQPRTLLLHANRNGFFYVLDRTDGRAAAGQAVREEADVGDARSARDGRPVLNPDQTPTAGGTTVCPAVEGATNWFSTAFIPRPGSTTCRRSRSAPSIRARRRRGGRAVVLRRGDAAGRRTSAARRCCARSTSRTGAIRWELPQTGPASSWGGMLATAGGLVFFGEDSGALVAVDAATGAPLWQFQANALWKASPMTYVFDGRQHIAVAAGPNIIAFRLIE